MIDAKDLRIGNWVNWNMYKDGKPGYVDAIVDYLNKKMIDVKNEALVGGFSCELKPEEIEPIPLTESILEKCGFKKYSHKPGYKIGDGDEMDEKCDEYTNRGLKLTIMDWGNGFILSNSFSFDLRVEIKTLHQLQNLIYSLTQKELEINL